MADEIIGTPAPAPGPAPAAAAAAPSPAVASPTPAAAPAATPTPAAGPAPGPAPAAAGPAPAASPAAAPAPAPSPAVAGTWPDNWRQIYVDRVKGDEKLLGRLQRYASPEAMFDALLSVQTKISAGELRANTPFPAAGTAEQQAEWRKMAGVPDAPDKYDVKLADGLVVGDNDKPFVDDFLKSAHGANMPAAHVNAALNWYFRSQENQAVARSEKDEALKVEVEKTLKAEWGPEDFAKNRAIMKAYLDTGAAGTADLVFSARLPDGTPLCSNLDFIRFLADRGREYNPSVTHVPGDAAGHAKSINDEIATLQALMGNKASEYWKGPKADAMQARYRELVAARDRTQGKTA